MEFKAWPKIQRLKPHDIIITEKMDGTNACIIVENSEVVGCQSRKRLLSLDEDNFGFANWVEKNKEELAKFGDGYHYGEWVGPGIQKNPHNLKEKTFYSFNVFRDDKDSLPCGCKTVPILYKGVYDLDIIRDQLYNLKTLSAEQGYKAEGIIIYNLTYKYYEKITFENPNGKWENQ